MLNKIKTFFTELGKYELKIELVEKPSPPEPTIHDKIKPFTLGNAFEDFKSQIDPEHFQAIKEAHKVKRATTLLDHEELIKKALSTETKKETLLERIFLRFKK